MTPYDRHEVKAPEAVFRQAAEKEEAVRPPIAMARKVYIKAADLVAYGYTRGCTKCEHELRYGANRSGQPHSVICRARIMGELAKTDVGRRRLAAASDRLDRSLADIGEEILGQGENADIAPKSMPVLETPEEVPKFEKLEPTAEDAMEEHHDMERAEPRMDEGMEISAITDTIREELTAEVTRRHMMGERQTGVNASVGNQPSSTDETAGPHEVQEQEPPRDEGASKRSADEGEEQFDTDFRELAKMWTKDMKEQLKKTNEEILSLIDSLGGNKHQYRKERARGLKHIVSEIYSPPRVTAAAKLLPELKCIPGFALDLTTVDDQGRAWDFDDKDTRERARKLYRETMPMLLIGSPVCTAWSAWQNLNNVKRDPEVVRKELIRARVHLEFCMELYREQHLAGRYFLHEHPAQASSWQEAKVIDLMQLDGVFRTTVDQCKYGMEDNLQQPIKKPTSFLTNSTCLVEELSTRCGGRHGSCDRVAGGRHVVCSGKRAIMAAIYHFDLCRAILVGFRKQMVADGKCRDGFMGMMAEPWDDMPILHVGMTSADVDKAVQNGEEVFKDDMTGQVLSPELVHAARRKELDYFASKGVWTKRTVAEAVKVSGKGPITVKWVDTNKGDDLNPNVRSRLVAREIRRAGEEPIFAPTPPLESLRTILSLAATDMVGRKPWCRDGKSEHRLQVAGYDISRAYLHAETDPNEPTYVCLPKEDPDESKGMCGLLKRHMYGTRKAADGWQQHYSRFMKSIGFRQGTASPCLFIHKERNIMVTVHGDDFTVVGEKCQIDWFQQCLEKTYECKCTGKLGGGIGDDSELRILNRIVRWTPTGLEYEADPRQCEKLLEEFELDEKCNTAATPGIKPLAQQYEDEQNLEGAELTRFRALAARANYLAADRPDVQFSCKEVCRLMASPTDLSMSALKRICRYLLGCKRVVYRFGWQTAQRLDCYSDTDWSGCGRTRRSTSGRCIMLGRHTLRTWSSTQPSVTLSSGEAEFYGVVKAAGAPLGHQTLLRYLDYDILVRV